MELKGSRSYDNLLSTFAGESQARNKYWFYSSVAAQEGYQQIAGIFMETAENEREHAKRAFRLAGLLGTTSENLADAIAGEHKEWSQLYREYADVAREEGFTELETFWREIGEVEEQHELRYAALRQRVEDGTVFVRAQPIKWHCRNCGYVHEGTTPPDVCPSCLHARAFFEEYAENF